MSEHVTMPTTGRRSLRAAAAVAVVGLSLALSACGSSGSSGASAAANNGQRPGGFGFAALTAKQRACLKEQGVTLPTRGNGQGGPPNGGAPPTNGQQAPPTNGQPPAGGQPNGQRRSNRNSAQAKKLQAAFQKCGISFGRPGQQGQQQQQPQSNSSSS